MQKNKNKAMIIGIVLLVVVMITGVSFALWQITLQQESTNVVNTTCFKINFTDENEINLQNAYPMSDEDGLSLEPYHFTIENICSTTATYQINLEELETELKRLSNQYVKVSLNHSKGKLLNSYDEVSTTLNAADTSHKLTTGVLKPDETKSFDLRLWMDEDTPAIDDVMNAIFLSKITIIAIQKEGLPEVEIAMQDNLNEITVDISTVENPNDETLTYFYQLNEEEEIESEENIYTFTNLEDGKYKARGRAETLDGIILSVKELDVTVAYEQVYISSTGNDETGNGSIENPYASLQPAYNKVKSGGEMILLSDITATSTTNMNIENKEVILRSDGENIYSIFRGDSLTTQLLNVTNENTLTTTNVTFDGNNVEANAPLLIASNSILNLNDNTLLTKSINNVVSVEINGGAILANNNSVINLNGASIFQNQVKGTALIRAQGGAIHIESSTLNLKNGSISYNTATSGLKNQGGGIYTESSNIIMDGGIVSYNSVPINNEESGGGGLWLANSFFEMNDGAIEYNQSNYGGGVWFGGNIKNTYMYMNGGIISNNSSTRLGGGVVVERNNENIEVIATLKSALVVNNTALYNPNTYTYNGGQIIDQR